MIVIDQMEHAKLIQLFLTGLLNKFLLESIPTVYNSGVFLKYYKQIIKEGRYHFEWLKYILYSSDNLSIKLNL